MAELVREHCPVVAATAHVAVLARLAAAPGRDLHPVHQPALVAREVLVAEIPPGLRLLGLGDHGRVLLEMHPHAARAVGVGAVQRAVDRLHARHLAAELLGVDALEVRELDQHVAPARVELRVALLGRAPLIVERRELAQLDAARQSVHLPAVEQPVAVAVAVERVGAERRFLGVEQTVGVLVVRARVGREQDAQQALLARPAAVEHEQPIRHAVAVEVASGLEQELRAGLVGRRVARRTRTRRRGRRARRDLAARGLVVRSVALEGELLLAVAHEQGTALEPERARSGVHVVRDGDPAGRLPAVHRERDAQVAVAVDRGDVAEAVAVPVADGEELAVEAGDLPIAGLGFAGADEQGDEQEHGAPLSGDARGMSSPSPNRFPRAYPQAQAHLRFRAS